ncbi:MAG: hypothetical protein IJ730_01020 [Alphaproteobacteria bacterium]|nr:hypothetical protein [Alphaproteobacteria bacterium]
MDGFKYDELVQQALISVVRTVLSDVSKNGLPGSHHFYIRFRTDHPKTKIPRFLKERHPEEVMIVIQYQYWNLEVNDTYFSVDLSFNGVHENLVIPYSALTAFVDPSVKFALQFTPSFSDGNDGTPLFRPKDDNPSDEHASESDGKIISLDNFRKK